MEDLGLERSIEDDPQRERLHRYAVSQTAFHDRDINASNHGSENNQKVSTADGKFCSRSSNTRPWHKDSLDVVGQ